MRQMCVCCVARSAPPLQFVMNVRSTIVLNVLTPTLVGPMLLNSQILLYYATCFVGKVRSPSWGMPCTQCARSAHEVQSFVCR